MGRGVRRVVTARQLRAAELLVIEGWSARRALKEAGYSIYSANKLSFMLAGSWGLREAIRRVEARLTEPLKARPKRRYARADTLAALDKVVVPDKPVEAISAQPEAIPAPRLGNPRAIPVPTTLDGRVSVVAQVFRPRAEAGWDPLSEREPPAPEKIYSCECGLRMPGPGLCADCASPRGRPRTAKVPWMGPAFSR